MMKPTTIRLTDEDRQLIAELKQRYGIRNTAELIRLALRMLQERKQDGSGKIETL